MKKALIIGAAGFVGKHLIKAIEETKDWLIYATKLPQEQIERRAGSRTREFEIRDLDILVQEEAVRIFREIQPDYVFHLAAQSSVASSWKNPDLTIDINIKGSVHVLEAARQVMVTQSAERLSAGRPSEEKASDKKPSPEKPSGEKASDQNPLPENQPAEAQPVSIKSASTQPAGKPRILLIGSGEEYGYVKPGEVPIREDTLLRPGNLYAATKACQNMIGSIYARTYGMEVMMVRAFNHIGPGQADMFVVSDFCRQAAECEAGKREARIRVGNLSAKRDFTDVRDVVRAYLLLMEHGKAGESYNVGSGNAVSIKELLDRILSQTKIPITAETDTGRLRPSDIPIIQADIGKLQEATGWRPEIPLDRTIRETLEYWRELQRPEDFR